MILNLFGEQRGVNAAEDHGGAAFANDPPQFVAAKRIGGVNADADDISLLNLLRIESFQALINDVGISKPPGRGGGKNVKPARGDDPYSERNVAGVDEVHSHCAAYSLRDTPEGNLVSA